MCEFLAECQIMSDEAAAVSVILVANLRTIVLFYIYIDTNLYLEYQNIGWYLRTMVQIKVSETLNSALPLSTLAMLSRDPDGQLSENRLSREIAG